MRASSRRGIPKASQERAAIENAGGRVIGSLWTQGRYDAVIVVEFPDDETASAFAISTGPPCEAVVDHAD